jgi:hypothetical protein
MLGGLAWSRLISLDREARSPEPAAKPGNGLRLAGTLTHTQFYATVSGYDLDDRHHAGVLVVQYMTVVHERAGEVVVGQRLQQVLAGRPPRISTSNRFPGGKSNSACTRSRLGSLTTPLPRRTRSTISVGCPHRLLTLANRSVRRTVPPSRVGDVAPNHSAGAGSTARYTAGTRSR